jgi:hypothetical protein
MFEPQKFLPLHYFIRVRNLGDRISPRLVAALVNMKAAWTNRSDIPHLMGSGSLISLASPTSYIWGTGLMSPAQGMPRLDPNRILALRGKLSLACVRKTCALRRDIPLGDPGYLAPALFGARAGSPRHELGVIPHYVDRFHPAVLALARQEGVLLLDIQSEPEPFFRQLARCRHVISSSLHGLIFAEAMQIPNAWVRFSAEIAGGNFKYRDWYSLCKIKQRRPHDVGTKEHPAALIKQCELHEPEISSGDLTQALQSAPLEEIAMTGEQRFFFQTQRRQAPTPVFIISFNRGAYLTRVIKSYLRFTRPVDIIIHDNGSTDPATLSLLRSLERQGMEVFYHPAISSPEQLNEVDQTVQAYFRRCLEPLPYVVTDCDIDMSNTPANALDIFEAVLNRFRDLECVGPMLKIRDIPTTYPLFNQVMNRHIEQFWQQRPNFFAFPFGTLAAIRAPIDTTFALHRAGEPFRRLKQGMRVYAPFEARHLDWYLDSAQENSYADSASEEISHWNQSEQLRQYRDVPLLYSEFFDVRPDQGGGLRTETVAVKGTRR